MLVAWVQAEGCKVDLLAIGEPYYLMKRICPYHMKVRSTQLCTLQLSGISKAFTVDH
jgi:hypothetical protein